MTSTTSTGAPATAPSQATDYSGVPVRMQYPVWKIALFALVILVAAQVIAIQIAKNY